MRRLPHPPSAQQAARSALLGRARLLVVGAATSSQGIEGPLAELGWNVQLVADPEAALRAPLPDACLVSLELADGDPFGLVEEIARRAGQIAFALFGSAPDYALCRRGFLAGARDVLGLPLDPERVHAALGGPSSPGGALYSPTLEVELTDAGIQRAMPELLAACLALGARPGVRARAATAVCELLHDARSHAAEASTGRCRVEVQPRAGGFEIALTGSSSEAAWTERGASTSETHGSPGGTTLARALCEELEISSSPEDASTVRMVFHDVPLGFETDAAGAGVRELDLADADFLSPEVLRSVLDRPRETPWIHLPPALAACLGRVLCGSFDPLAAQSALWRDVQ